MLATVIKPFAFYADGITLENLSVGDERDFGAMTEGLVKEGYVVLAEAQAAEPGEEVIETKPAVEEPIETKPMRRSRK